MRAAPDERAYDQRIESGQSAEDHMKRFPAPLDPAGVARAILTIASGEEHREATALTVTGEGLEVV